MLSFEGVVAVLNSCPNIEYVDFVETVKEFSMHVILLEINLMNFILHQGEKIKGVAISSEGRSKCRVDESFQLEHLLENSATRLQCVCKSNRKEQKLSNEWKKSTIIAAKKL